jgi:hypothetical protein
MQVRFQALTAASMKMSVFWDVSPFSLVEFESAAKCVKNTILEKAGRN